MTSPENKGKLASAKGFANESRLLAALLERGYNASSVDLPLSSYDILVELKGGETIRVQVKTVSKSGSVSFVGGGRGGVDRAYKSGVKTYTQNTKTSDIVVGVRSVRSNGDKRVDFYFIPTLLIEILKQQSIAISRIPKAENNWQILEQCKNSAQIQKFFNSVITRKRGIENES